MVISRTFWKKIKKIYNPKTLKEIVRSNINLDDKQLNKELAKKMIKHYYFTSRALQVGFNITLDSHQINLFDSKLNVKPVFLEFGIEHR